MKKAKPEFIFFYSIGRSGTAYLSQVFGKKKWKPKDLCFPEAGVSVAHEKWAMRKEEIEKLKLLKPKSEEALEIQKKKIKRIVSANAIRNVNRIFISDSAFGRWCAYGIIQNYNYKAVLLKRNKNDVINSWKNMYKEYTKKNSKDKAKELLESRFNYNYFNILDKYTLLHVDKSKWKEYSIEEKIGWYYDETIAKWINLKLEMDPKKYFETSYENIITIEGLKELSDFIELPFDYDLMKIKINMSQHL